MDALFSQHFTALYKVALKKLGNPADAEDALQDALLSAYTHLNQFKGESQISTWLTSIVLNSARMRIRRQASHRQVSLDAQCDETGLAWSDKLADARPDPEETFRKTQLREVLERFVEKLPPRIRPAFRLRVLEGLSTSEAAAALGVCEGTLKAQFFRACRQITPLMREALVTPRQM